MALIKLNNQSLTAVSALPAGVGGKVLQVQYTQFTGTASLSISANTYTPLTDLTVSITPTSASSKILLQTHVFWEGSVSDYTYLWMFFRDSTVLKASGLPNQVTGISASRSGHHDADQSSTPTTAVYQYFDTPSTTSAITYKVGVNNENNNTLYINRSLTDGNSLGYERGISHISAMEIAA